MAIRSIITHRFSMNATVLSLKDITSVTDPAVGQEEWGTRQDPITGEILNVWGMTTPHDNPVTSRDESSEVRTIPCLVRGIVDGGIRVAGTTERFGDNYENVDFVKMWVPANIRLSKRDQITNIKDKRNGKLIWLDEEYSDGTRATIFNVNGVTPLFDAFNRHIESFVLLEKAV